MKNFKIHFLLTLCIVYSCSKNNYIDIHEVLELEVDIVNNITQKKYDFLNTNTNQKVSVLHHLEETGFHFYNSVKFKTENIGVLVGGTGLRVRITENGGETWKQFRFSSFANSFHSISFSEKSLFIVGESKYIFKSSDFGENWSVFNTEYLFKTNDILQVKYYKIHFFNHLLGFIAGEQNGHSVLLKTINGGADWSIIETKGLVGKESAITDFKIMSENEVILVTQSGKCYKSIDQGNNWELLYRSENEYKQLNSIDFKDINTGFIGGSNGTLLNTNDGGKTWNTIEVPRESVKSNISDILFLKDQILITSAQSFNNEERETFVYSINDKESNFRPFLTKTDSNVFFVGDSYGLDVRNDTVYIIDRNNLYKTLVGHKD